MKRKSITWICVASFVFGSLILKPKELRADMFGGDVVVLTQILMQTIQQVNTMMQMLGKARDTLSLLEEMNRGVKEVLRLGETAHVPIPKSIYEKAKAIDIATSEARRIYGKVNDKSPASTKTHFQSGVEGLFLSQDAFEYSHFLDEQGSRVKSASVIANQGTATRLTAESMGVLLHAVSHTNRLQAKELEIASTNRLEESAKESAKYDSFIEAHTTIENELNRHFSSLNSLSDSGNGNGETK